MSQSKKQITILLKGAASGDPAHMEKLAHEVYGHLKKIAGDHVRKERGGRTLQPTALVNEAFMRIFQSHVVDWQNRAHFFAIASTVMRRILIEHARKRHALKRGADPMLVTLDEAKIEAGGETVDFLALDRALTRLAEIDERQSRIVELRYFGGLGIEETAAVLACSTGTVKREWLKAKLFLLQELEGEEEIKKSSRARG